MSVLRARFSPRGGVHLRYAKDLTEAQPIETMPAPKSLFVSMSQHLGAPSKARVKKGDAVWKGQPIGEPTGFVSSWVHAPTSGTVKAVSSMLTAAGRTAMVVEIEADGLDRSALPDGCAPDEKTGSAAAAAWGELSPRDLVERVMNAGIIGMGGAGFPTHVKLTPPPGKSIQMLIINGAECEPYLTADHRLMVEQAHRIWEGARILRKVLGASQVRLAIEDNKPDAIRAMEQAIGREADDARIVVLKTTYPQGAEKQLIRSVTGREVPSGGLPMDVGVVVENVGTAAAVRAAVADGTPLIERVMTVSGDAIRNPRNLRVRVGVAFRDVVGFCGGLTEEPGKIICGGPMMGVAQPSLDPAVSKTTSGLLLFSRRMVESFSSMPCISCGRCVAACPARLMPCLLSEYVESEDYAAAEATHVTDCIECGSCAFVCPSHRPMVQQMRQGKSMAMARRRQREAVQKQEKMA